MTRPTGRPRGRPPRPPAPDAHAWERVTAEDGTERHRCRVCGARHGAWLAHDERPSVHAGTTRGDAARSCGAGSVYVLPHGGTTADLARAERAWRPRPVGRIPSGHRRRVVSLVLDDETSVIWDEIGGDRSAWIRTLMRDAREPSYRQPTRADDRADHEIDLMRERDLGID